MMGLARTTFSEDLLRKTTQAQLLARINTTFSLFIYDDHICSYCIGEKASFKFLIAPSPSPRHLKIPNQSCLRCRDRDTLVRACILFGYLSWWMFSLRVLLIPVLTTH